VTLTEIKELLVAVDPHIRHYYSMEERQDYTYWEETDRLPFTADGLHVEGWTFYVHRFTRDSQDAVATALFSVLDADPRIALSHTVAYEPESEYIHHIYRCEAL